ncbi:MAG: arylesterase, partial [Dokdonella sp.]
MTPVSVFMLRGTLLLMLLLGSAAQAATRPVLVLGDSLSAAYGIAIESGWVNLLDQRLAKQTPARRAINASISGETSSGGLARLDALLTEHKPALVLVELGANDALRGLPISEPTRNLGTIIEHSRKAGAKVVLIGIEIPLNYGPQYRDRLRTMYRGLASDFNVPLVPFLLDGVALDPNLMQADGLHPTAAAQPQVLET